MAHTYIILTQSTGEKAKTKASSGKKKRKAATDATTTGQKTKPSRAKGKKRKRGKKSSQKDSTDGGVASQGSSKVNALRDLESKRREKRELERQRDEEARERARLEEELRRLRESKTGDEEPETSVDGSGDGGRGEYIATAKGGTMAEVDHRRSEDMCHRKRDSTEG